MSKQTDISKFTSSEAKNFIRDIFDFEIIRAFKHEYYQDASWETARDAVEWPSGGDPLRNPGSTKTALARRLQPL